MAASESDDEGGYYTMDELSDLTAKQLRQMATTSGYPTSTARVSKEVLLKWFDSEENTQALWERDEEEEEGGLSFSGAAPPGEVSSGQEG
eukprot:1473142-Rhodomonas_salina.5